MNIEVKKYIIEKVSEFYKLPKNEIIEVNGYTIKILWNNDIWFGVEFEWGIEEIERALYMLHIYRDAKYINNISQIGEDEKFINTNMPSDIKYVFNYESKNGSCDIEFEFYRTFSSYGYLNNIIISPLICEININKETVIDNDDESDNNKYSENREYCLDIYGDTMIPERHIYFAELETEDDEMLDNIFQDIANMFNRRYVFHEYGIPSKIIEPEKKK